MENELLTNPSVAALFAISRATLDRWVAAGILERVHIGGKSYVTRRSVEALTRQVLGD